MFLNGFFWSSFSQRCDHTALSRVVRHGNPNRTRVYRAKRRTALAEQEQKLDDTSKIFVMMQKMIIANRKKNRDLPTADKMYLGKSLDERLRL